MQQYPHDYFLWSAGAYSRNGNHSAAATLISKDNHIYYTSSFKLDTKNIATAELCGVLANLTWLLRTKNLPPSVHIMCDNQYTIKTCLKFCNPHRDHVTLYHNIHLTTQALHDVTTIHFHWIPSHTNNSFHQKVDSLAITCLHIPPCTSRIFSINELLQQHTDALASGRVYYP